MSTAGTLNGNGKDSVTLKELTLENAGCQNTRSIAKFAWRCQKEEFTKMVSKWISARKGLLKTGE